MYSFVNGAFKLDLLNSFTKLKFVYKLFILLLIISSLFMSHNKDFINV